MMKGCIGWSPVIGNRMKLDLYANVRPVRCLPGMKHGISGRFAEVRIDELRLGLLE